MGLEQWAERRDGLITGEQVAKSGLSARQVARRRSEGAWRGVRRGVMAVNGTPRSWQQEVRALLLSCGDGVSASHWTAVGVLGGTIPDQYSDGFHVSGSLRRMVRMAGVVHHRSTTFEPGDIIVRHGLRCTSAVRTVIDISGSTSVEQLGRIVDDLLRRRLLRLADLRERVSALRSAPGRSIPTLRRVLAARLPDYDPGDSELESRLALLLAAGRIRAPVQQFKVQFGPKRYRLDFAYPDVKIYLEGNGFGCHSIASDLDNDARRQNSMVIDGWRPIELTWRMTDAEILDTLRAVGLAA